MKPRSSFYSREIQKDLDARGITDIPAGAIEWVMRLEHRTLDAIDQAQWAAEVRLGIEVIRLDRNMINYAAAEGYCERAA